MQSESPISWIPPEIIYDIISLHKEHSAPLAACSLTCRAWAAISQSYLLREVRLGLGLVSSAWTHRTSLSDDRDSNSDSGELDGFFQCLDINPYIGTYVRVLHISSSYLSGWEEMDVVVSRLENKLPDVQILRLQSMNRFSDRFGSLMAASFPALRILEIAGGYSQPNETLIGVLLANPALESVSLGSYVALGPSERIETTLHSNEVGTLRLNEVYCTSIHMDCLSELTLLGVTSNLHTLHISYYSFGEFGGLENILTALGDTLEALTLSVKTWQDPIDTELRTLLKPNAHLRKLEFRGWEPRTSPDWTSEPILFAILSSLTSSCLEELILYFNCRHVADLNAVNWARLTVILRGTTSAKLLRLKIYLAGKVWEEFEDAKKCVEDGLSYFGERGRLGVRLAQDRISMDTD